MARLFPCIATMGGNSLGRVHPFLAVVLFLGFEHCCFVSEKDYSSQILKKVCGKEDTSETVYTSSSVLYIRFVSDSGKVATGFNISINIAGNHTHTNTRHTCRHTCRYTHTRARTHFVQIGPVLELYE